MSPPGSPPTTPVDPPIVGLDGLIDPLERLARDDKWSLGGGRGLVFAPPFPLHLERPGFWDAAHYLHFPLEPVVTWTLLDEFARPILLRQIERRWRPDRLEARYVGGGLVIDERRACLDIDALIAEVTVRAAGDELDAGERVRVATAARVRRLQLVAWTAQPIGDGAGASQGQAGSATAGSDGLDAAADYRRDGEVPIITRRLTTARDQALPVSLALGLTGTVTHAAQLSEPTANHPWFELTPFAETVTPAGLDGTEPPASLAAGLLYVALARPLDILAEGIATAVVIAGVGSSREAAVAAARTALAEPDPVGRSECAWRAFFDGLPRFRCSDPYLETAWYHRWFGLRLNTIDVREGNLRHPVVCEGIGYFRLPIGYSAQAHLREARWSHDPSLALGIAQTFLDLQTEAGTFPAHIYRDWSSPTDIYHADWGPALLAPLEIHPDAAADLLPRIRDGLARYAEWLLRERDPDGSGLVDVVTQWETGQEYQSRYLAADPEGDAWRPLRAPLKGIDASVYALRLFETLAALAPDGPERDRWAGQATATADALRERCWDSTDEAFHDLTRDGRRVPTLHATSFYPYWTDAVGPEHLSGLRRHLLDPDEFWTPFPIPSSSPRDPRFSATPDWKGVRRNCPWNGRTWPMSNSHVVEALAHASTLDPSLRGPTAELLHRSIRMMFLDGDPRRPTAYEHYNPLTGRPSVYRGIDDYQHAWVIDLLVRFVAGVRPGPPGATSVTIDPFPAGVAFRLEDVRIAGRRLDVAGDPVDGLRVWLDGRLVAERRPIGAVTVALAEERPP